MGPPPAEGAEVDQVTSILPTSAFRPVMNEILSGTSILVTSPDNQRPALTALECLRLGPSHLQVFSASCADNKTMASEETQLEVESSSSSGQAEERHRPSKKSRSSSKGQRSKVRTGCKTGKVRRLKCDEARPACLRCTATGRLCDGYGPLTIVSLPFDISGTEEERRSYHFFRLQTATVILGQRDSEYWTTSLLQLSYARQQSDMP